MATKKETARKKATKKATSKKIVNETSENIIENEVIEEVKVDSEIAEELKKISDVKVDFVEQDPPMEVMNGDPNVLTPTEEPKIEEVVKEKKTVVKTPIEEINEKALKDTFKGLNNNKKTRLDRTFGYSWNGMEMDY